MAAEQSDNPPILKEDPDSPEGKLILAEGKAAELQKRYDRIEKELYAEKETVRALQKGSEHYANSLMELHSRISIYERALRLLEFALTKDRK